MSLSDPLHGSIKFFNDQKLFGFFTPDVLRPDGKDIFFHRDNCEDVRESEIVVGELEFIIGSQLERQPKKTARVVFIVEEKTRGPSAFQWTYEDLWDKRMQIINARPKPDELYCHVVDGGNANNDYKKTIVWDGWRAALETYLTNARPDLSPESNVYLEELRAHGWERMWHPANWHPAYKTQDASGDVGDGEINVEEVFRRLKALGTPG